MLDRTWLLKYGLWGIIFSQEGDQRCITSNEPASPATDPAPHDTPAPSPIEFLLILEEDFGQMFMSVDDGQLGYILGVLLRLSYIDQAIHDLQFNCPTHR